jgi:magnesium-transporting ATPase (P-type)
LTKKLENLAEVIKGYAHIAAFLIFCTLLLFLVCNILFNDSAELLSQDTLQKLIRAFTTGVAIIIVSVPEGLGLAVSISMAFSISQMK